MITQNNRIKNPKYNVTIAMCGKYTELPDAYKSVLESFIHAGAENDARVSVKWIQTDKIRNYESAHDVFQDVDGILLTIHNIVLLYYY